MCLGHLKSMERVLYGNRDAKRLKEYRDFEIGALLLIKTLRAGYSCKF